MQAPNTSHEVHKAVQKCLEKCIQHPGKKEIHALRLSLYRRFVFDKAMGRKTPKGYRRLYKKLGKVRDWQRSRSLLKSYDLPRKMEKKLTKAIEETRHKLERYFQTIKHNAFYVYEDGLVEVNVPRGQNPEGTYQQFSQDLLQTFKKAKKDKAHWHDLRKALKNIYQLDAIPEFNNVYYAEATLSMFRSWSSLIGMYHDYDKLYKKLKQLEEVAAVPKKIKKEVKKGRKVFQKELEKEIPKWYKIVKVIVEAKESLEGK